MEELKNENILEEKDIFYGRVEDLKIEGWYLKGVHSEIPENSIKCDEELYKYLLSLYSYKFKNKKDIDFEKEYTIEDKELFEQTGIEYDYSPSESMIADAEMLLSLADKEARILALEKNIEKLLNS